MPRYFIEQAPNRFYDPSSLTAAKARAARLSRTLYDAVYIIEERFDREKGDWFAAGSIAYIGGYQDAREGTLANA